MRYWRVPALHFARGAGCDDAHHFRGAQSAVEDRDFVDEAVENVSRAISLAEADGQGSHYRGRAREPGRVALGDAVHQCVQR